MHRAELLSNIADDLVSLKRVLLNSWTTHYARRLPTPAQIGILALIVHRGPQNLKDLAKTLGISSSAATQLVEGLVKERFLTSTADKADHRRIRLALTVFGKRSLARARKMRLVALTKLLAPLSTAELGEWKRLQTKIIEHAS